MNKNEISIQVYTARKFKPYEKIFKFLFEQGIKNVELFEVEAFDETKYLLENFKKPYLGLFAYPNTQISIATNIKSPANIKLTIFLGLLK